MIDTLLLSVQARLREEVKELRYIDKDWGQLGYPQPAVAWPCALLDVENIGYTQTAQGGEVADGSIIITVANQRLTSSSQKAPRREEAYKTIELIGKMHQALQLFTDGTYAPLFRSALRRVRIDSSREEYQLIYQTAFVTAVDLGEGSVPGGSVKIEIDQGIWEYESELDK